MIYNIPLPRLLDASGGEARRINAQFAAVNLNITPLSTATIELLDNDSIPARSYVEMFTSSGSAGVFRTRTPQVGYGTQSNTVEMEHAICEIGDYLVTAKIETEKTAAQAISQLFGYYGGSKWQLGSVASTDTVTLEADYDNILQSILAVMEQIPGYMMTFNFLTTPWTFSVVAKPSSVAAEGRLSRNVQSVRIIEDDSELCTRVYAKGLGSGGAYGYMDADTITTYGVVERVASNSKMTSAQATRVANLYLEKHKHPRLSIEIDAQDLAQITGESLDELAIGNVYRLALPDYNVTREETITALQYSDIYGAPGSVGVTLSEEEETAVSFLHKTGSGGAGTRKKVEEDYAWIEDLNDRVSLVAMDMQGLDARIDVTASQIRSEVSDSVSGLHSSITQTASQIRSEVSGSISSAYYSIIDQTDSHIRSEVGTAVSGIYSSVIEQTGSYIRQEIAATGSEIASSVIEQTGSYIRSEIASAASGVTSSVIVQTQSYVRQVVGVKTQTYVSYDDPASAPGADIHDGDMWHESNGIETWEQLNELDWSEAYAYDWQEYLGGITHLRKNGEWVEISNEQAVALNTQGITETEKAIRIAKADADNNYAHFLVTASMIRSEVKNTRDGLSSSITQTASQIRTEVNNTAAGLQSSITQNAGQIELKVSKNGVISSINQTPESVTINASRINLTGHAIASELSATNATIANLMNGTTQAGYIRAASFRAGSITFGSYDLRRGYITVDDTRFNVVMWG